VVPTMLVPEAEEEIEPRVPEAAFRISVLVVDEFVVEAFKV
jgi:hypothetical protein